MLASLLAALLAALCYGIASVLMAMAVRAASRRPAAPGGGPAVDPGLVLRMLRQWRFLVSIVVDLAGFVAQLVALRRLPVFAVQATVASNLAVTAVCAAWLMKARLSRREWLAVAGVVVGIGLLSASAGTAGAARTGTAFQVGLIVAIVVIGAGGFAASALRGPVRTPVVGAISGLGYAVLAVAARTLPGLTLPDLVRSAAAYTVVAAGIISYMLYAAALDAGSVTTATAAVVLAETVPPAVVGLVFLGDTTRPDLAAVAVLGFALAVACAVALARFGEGGQDRAPHAASGHTGVRQTAGRR